MKMRGFMKRLLSLFAILGLFCSFITAQTLDLGDFDIKIEEEPSNEWTIAEGTFSEQTETVSENGQTFVYAPNQQGDQFVRLNLALELPLRPTQLKLGGTGTLSYGIFLTESFNLSAKASFAYTTTLGSNIFYFVPFTVCAQYQMLFKNFEVPVSIELGGAIESYIDRLIFGFVVKPEAGLFYRVTPDWSIGVYAGLYIMPQWYRDSTYNYTGIISDIGLSVRYHF